MQRTRIRSVPTIYGEIVVGKRADPNIKAFWPVGSSPGRRALESSPIHLALRRDESLRLIELLLEYGVEPLKSSQALITAVQLEKATEFRLLVENAACVFAHFRRVSVDKRAMNSGCQPIIDVLLERRITHDTIRR